MNQISSVRVAIITTLFVLLYAAAIVHVLLMQTVQAPFFLQIAQQQYQLTVTQRPPRAPIYDRNGQPLALNREAFSVFVTPNNLQEKKRLEPFLKKHFPDAYERLAQKKGSCFMYVKRHLTEEERALVVHANLPDLHLLCEEGRLYPQPSLGHTVGLTNIDADGIAGIELLYNQRLAGHPTTYLIEKDARSHTYYFKKEVTQSGKIGSPVTLTIDGNLQFIAYECVREHVEKQGALEGMAIIMDPINGEILAMACLPDFDPNKPVADLALTKNRIITEVHEFGSVMKIFTALAAFEEKVVTADEIIDCEDRKQTMIDGVPITTWKAFGKLTYADVIRNSNNIGTSKVALRIGRPLYTHLKDFGFACTTGLNYPGEQIGWITPPERWSKPTLPHLSFGYEISASLLQLARAFAIISNGGYLVTPRLVINPAPTTHPQPAPVCSTETINTLRTITTLSHERSAARVGLIPGYTVMGKTGTALLLTDDGTYDPCRSLYTFAGAVERGAYKRVITVSIREPRPRAGHVYAASVALPLFKEIAERMLVTERIVPEKNH